MASSEIGGFNLADGQEGTIYGFGASLLNGTPVEMGEFRGKVLLIVNTASKCGFTSQYEGLEELYRTYKDRGLEVLGFPCNQFGRQEPGSAEEIWTFCESRFGVSFPIFAKIDVNGKDAHPLYRFLETQKPGWLGFLDRGAVRWNFTKFLVDGRGKVVDRFAPSTKPKALAGRIEELLSKP